MRRGVRWACNGREMGRGGCKVVAANSIISWEPEAGEALGFNILTPSLTQPEISCHVAIGKPCQLGSSSSWKLRPPSTHPVLLTASGLSVCLSVFSPCLHSCIRVRFALRQAVFDFVADTDDE